MNDDRTSADEKKRQREIRGAGPALQELDAYIRQGVEDKLAPALENRKVQSCLHIMDDMLNQGRLRSGGKVDAGKHQPLICIDHPYRLLCNQPKCLETHVRIDHKDDPETVGRCYVCQAPWREDSTEVTMQVHLRKPVPFFADNRARDRWITFSGDLWTLPVAFLCPRHADALALPLQMQWPPSRPSLEAERAVEDVRYSEAAKKVRWIIDNALVPRVGYMFNRTLDGETVPGCTHLVDAPGAADRPGAAYLDWMCEGVGLLCRDCIGRHMNDLSSPHRDPRHEVCIVCGHHGQDLKPMFVPVILDKPLMVSSQALDALSEIRGARQALGIAGSVYSTPVAWECPAHDGFYDLALELYWPPDDVRPEDVMRG